MVKRKLVAAGRQIFLIFVIQITQIPFSNILWNQPLDGVLHRIGSIWDGNRQCVVFVSGDMG